MNKEPERTVKGTVIAVFVGILLSLTVGEILLWALDKGDPSARTMPRYLTLREHLINQKTPLVSLDPLVHAMDKRPDRPYLLETDEDAFLKPSKLHENPDFSAVFLGASTTEALFMEPQERFPYLVGRLLEKRHGIKVNTYNGGVSGNHSMHSNLILMGKVLPMRPNVVVMMHNMADLATLLYLDGYWGKAGESKVLIREMPTPRKRPALFRFLQAAKDLTFPRLFSVLKSSTGGVVEDWLEEGGVPTEADDFKEVRGKKIRIERERYFRDFTSSLKTFIGICRAWGVEPVLMTQANRLKIPSDPDLAKKATSLRKMYGIESETYLELYHSFNGTIRQVARESGVLLVDLEASIPASVDYLYDDVHMNEKGSRRAAEVIADALSKRFLPPVKDVAPH